MRKAKLVGLALLASLLVASGVSGCLRRPPRITLESYHRIDAGMTVSEVVAIPGPPGDYTSGPTSDTGWQETAMYLSDFRRVPEPELRWMTDSANITVSFDSIGGTDTKAFCFSRREEQTPLQNLCWLARREWRRRFPENVAQTGYIRPQPPEF
jgi:hypothetical protein